jgi:hypothetical protein
MVRRGRAEAPVPRSDVSFRLDQKTSNFNLAAMTMCSRTMQWSHLTEGNKRINLLKQSRFIKIIIVIRGGAITRWSSPLYQRCTAAKDGKLQGRLWKKSNAVECVH